MKTLNSIALKTLPLALVAALFLTDRRPARADDAPKPLATAKHPSGLVVEVLSVSIDDTQGKLKITWRYTNPTKKPIRLVEPGSPFVQPRKSVPWVQYWDAVNYRAGKLDDDKAFHYSVVQTKDGKYVDGTDFKAKGVVVPAEGQYEMFAKFSKPQGREKLIHLQLPEVPQFENLPVKGGKKD